MKRSLVSIIVPVYNVDLYLRQCVDSILSQTYQNLEIILVDDGSSDKSAMICDDYSNIDSRINVIHKSNGGLSDARNVGIDTSNGVYLFFLDADDYLAPKCIEELVVASNTGDFVICGYKLDFCDEKRIVEVKQAYGWYSTTKDFINDFHNLFATKFNFAWGKLYNAEIIKKNNLYFKKGIALVEDVLFNLEYYRYCDKGIHAITYDGYYYRQHGTGTLSKKFHTNLFDWNELSYTLVRDYLKEFDCFTDKNREHLYRNIVGNYHYGFYLIANNDSIRFSEKVSLIRKHISTPIYQESLSVKQRKRMDYRILEYLLQHGMIRSYIYMENLKRLLKHVYN